MKIYKVFSDYCDTNTITRTFFTSFNLKSSERYGTDYIFTCDDNFTHAIIINKAMPHLTIPKENVIGLAYEPPVFLQLNQAFIDYVKAHVSKYYIGKTTLLLPNEFIEKYSCLIYNSNIPISPKTKTMSIIFSHKQWTDGHRYRHELVRRILETNLPIDIYGLGCGTLTTTDSRIKGAFKGTEPYDGYMFHISIENVSIPEYFSEKITQALVSKCVPIYWGCTHIDNYFPGLTHKLVGNVDRDMKTITSICNNPKKYYEQINIDVETIKKTCNIENVL